MEAVSDFILAWLKPLMFIVILIVLVLMGVSIFGLVIGLNAQFGTFFALAAYFSAAVVIKSKV